MQEKVYGLAVSYYMSAQDWPGLGRVIEHVLNEYINNGKSLRCGSTTIARFPPGSEAYVRYVADIAPSLPDLRTSSGPPGIFIHLLDFSVRFAGFQRHRLDHKLQDAAWDLVEMLQQDIAPRSWWAVLLHEAVDFLLYSRFYQLCT